MKIEDKKKHKWEKYELKYKAKVNANLEQN